jgi:hypothetical protein
MSPSNFVGRLAHLTVNNTQSPHTGQGLTEWKRR